MNAFVDAHYFQIPSQGNIYTLTHLQMKNRTNKILVAGRKEIFLFDYADNHSPQLSPTTKEVPFMFNPTGADIISIDAYNKSSCNNEHVIGVTLVKVLNEDDKKMYLNIYTEYPDSEMDFNIESISQNCFTLELSFIPYQLTHTNLTIWEENKLLSNEIVFLLSGSDNTIHVYHEEKDHFKEIDVKSSFPEFYKAPSVVMWIDVQYYNDYENRLSVFGCECGYIRVCKVDCKSNEAIQIISTQVPDMISNVRIFSNKVQKGNKDNRFDLLITNTLIPSVVFKNVLEDGFSDKYILERNDCYNVFSCSVVADITFNGLPHILIGSREQELYFFKQDAAKGWVIKYLKEFSHPILALLYVDVTGDGVKELIVSTTRGVHVLQHDQRAVQRALEDKINNIYIPKVET